MVLKNFDDIRQNMKSDTKRTVAVASAIEDKTLEAVLEAHDMGLVDYILTGPRDEILKTADEIGRTVDRSRIIDAESDHESAVKAVELIRSGDADFLQKGLLHTSTMLKAVVNKEHGLRAGKMMNYVAVFESDYYHKLFAITDGGMQIAPNLAQKKEIIESTVELFHSFGVKRPKVACMCAVEEINPKMPETLDAEELKQMNQSGILNDCIVEGPISYDLAVSKRSAEIKGYDSPVAGDADLILFPDLVSGNLTTKALEYHAGVKGAAVITGAKVPIIFGSRSATTQFRYRSVALAAVSVQDL